MKPICPIPKRATGFSIESLISKDRRTEEEREDQGDKRSPSSSEDSDQREDSPLQAFHVEGRSSLASRLPPLHPSLPAHVKHLLLANQASSVNPDIASAWAFANHSLGAYPSLGVGLPPQVYPGVHLHPSLHPSLLATQRDPLSLHPWLLARQSHATLGLPFAGPHDTGFLFHPYRKPKRVRTAFSPDQLLKLEHAFEKNHYVVGQERKDLGSKLNLTETQVKVWFQNRRTKHKRLKMEGGDSDCSNINVDDDEVATSSNMYENEEEDQQTDS